jgi:Fe-S cluster assembly protein SufD
MTEAHKLQKNNLSHSAAFEAADWLKVYMQTHHTNLLSSNLPDRKNEAWKYTNIQYLSAENVVSPVESTLTHSDLLPFRIENTDLMVFINGYFSETLSDEIATPGILPFSRAQALHQDLILEQLLKNNQYFTTLHHANLSDGIFIALAENQKLAKTVHCLFIHTDENNFIYHPTNMAILADGASASVVIEVLDYSAKKHVINMSYTITLHKNSALNLYQKTHHADGVTALTHTHVTQFAQSDFVFYTTQKGGKVIRHDMTVDLKEPYAKASLKGFYLADQKHQIVDNVILINHFAPNCESEMIFKGTIENKAIGVFDGKVYVAQNAQKTLSKQVNKTLLLTPDAQMNAKPQFEIYADDVKCAHGATVGQIDAEALFYLRSRGIHKDIAMNLLVDAFAKEIFTDIKESSLFHKMTQMEKP